MMVRHIQHSFHVTTAFITRGYSCDQLVRLPEREAVLPGVECPGEEAGATLLCRVSSGQVSSFLILSLILEYEKNLTLAHFFGNTLREACWKLRNFRPI
jgi:hypothetical protein